MNSEPLGKSNGQSMHCPRGGSIHVISQNILNDQESLYGLQFDLRKEVDYSQAFHRAAD